MRWRAYRFVSAEIVSESAMNRSLKASAHTSEAVADRCTHQTQECLSDVDRETTRVRASYLSNKSDRPHRLHCQNRSSCSVNRTETYIWPRFVEIIRFCHCILYHSVKLIITVARCHCCRRGRKNFEKNQTWNNFIHSSNDLCKRATTPTGSWIILKWHRKRLFTEALPK